jgi:hypothetical protein
MLSKEILLLNFGPWLSAMAAYESAGSEARRLAFLLTQELDLLHVKKREAEEAMPRQPAGYVATITPPELSTTVEDPQNKSLPIVFRPVKQPAVYPRTWSF